MFVRVTQIINGRDLSSSRVQAKLELFIVRNGSSALLDQKKARKQA
jgi:hypothetical protein